MTTTEIIIAVTIHLIIPLTALIMYLGLVRKMKSEKIENPPTIDLFLTFATYGGLLLVTLTTLFWKWSGMASLGSFYLILGAPIVMGIIAYRNSKKKELSIYHLRTYKAGLLYFLITPITFGLLVLIE
ncbi:MAG: hypothetical protein HRT69_10545 [Flavobacteriaceae bacterium]|nr:hypothetical protein [Flavobacteriaceae bacterium]